MTFTEAAAQVLRLVGKPLHYKEITDVAIERNLLSHVGKSPEVTMGARLAALVKKAEKDNPLVRVKPGVFALREWDEGTIKRGLADRTPALQRLEQNAADGEVPEDESELEEVAAEEEAGEEEPSLRSAGHVPVAEVEDELVAPDEEERSRAQIAASATDLFEPEDDDDEPIFSDAVEEEEDDDRPERDSSSRRRRRRRRRRAGTAEENRDGNDLPSYTVTDAPLQIIEAAEIEAPVRGRENDRGRGKEAGLALDGLAGAELADALASLLLGHDRNNGPVSLHKLAEGAHRKGRISGEVSHTQALFAAVARADNLRRAAEGLRPRFRITGSRVGLTEWLLDGELGRAERDVQSALDKYREAVRRSLLRHLQQLPQRALGELSMLLLERIGISGLSTVKRAGAATSELHLAGVLSELGSEVRVAVVVRRDGRDVGREQVIDLRGALHHYGSAAAGWILTLGQILSGAREEGSAAGAAPVTLVDGETMARLCEQHGVGVSRIQFRLALPDVELFDALRTG